MIFGCCFFCVFAVLINKVSLQETVEAVIGGSVDLLCFSTEHDLKPQNIDVHWRHNGSENVCDIVKGKDSREKQDPRYKNRAETFPDEYLRGNFSIKLNNLTPDDAGKYTCFIIHSSELQTVQLIIKDSTAEKESKSTEQENQEEETVSDSVETPLIWLPIVVVVLLLFIILSIFSFVIYRRKKRNQPPSFSPVRNEDKKQ